MSSRKKPAAPAGKQSAQSDAHPPAKVLVFLQISKGPEDVLGRLEFELSSDVLPRSCENFRQLCVSTTVGDKKNPKSATYVGTKFIRVNDTIIQGGDVTGRDDMKGQESIYGAAFDDEALGVVPHTFGVLSMVNSGPNTNGSQFFVCLQDAQYLDKRCVSIGKLVSGEQTLRDLHDILTQHTTGDCGMISKTCPLYVSASGVVAPSPPQ